MASLLRPIRSRSGADAMRPGRRSRTPASVITSNDGTEIFYKDWGSGQPIVFSHGWPLSADDWDAQMMLFLQHGYRVVAHDRRGHGRSAHVADGLDMDHYAHDLAAVVAHLDLRNAIHVGHSTGGGEVVRYLARHGEERVAGAAVISAVPPLIVQSEANPGGLPQQFFDDFQAQVGNQSRSSISTSHRGRSTASTVPTRSLWRGWCATGGARAWRAARRRTTTASWRSHRPTSPRT
jgi:pimeloyl-ACP methyl ester carboxylesterase